LTEKENAMSYDVTETVSKKAVKLLKEMGDP
jgi:hypothetical protein